MFIALYKHRAYHREETFTIANNKKVVSKHSISDSLETETDVNSYKRLKRATVFLKVLQNTQMKNEKTIKRSLIAAARITAERRKRGGLYTWRQHA